MFSASSLTEEQTQGIREWAAAGAQIADIQKKMNDEYAISITYMEARFLVLDLEVEIITEEEEPEPEPEKVEKIATGEVHVTVDTVVRAGAAISGSVEFSDGEKAGWSIDSMGRLNLDADEVGYRPSEMDLQMFQDKLREHLQGIQ